MNGSHDYCVVVGAFVTAIASLSIAAPTPAPLPPVDWAAAERREARAAATRANTVVDSAGHALVRTRRGSTAIAVNDTLAGHCPSLAADPALRCAVVAALVFLVGALVLVYCFRDEIRALSARTVTLDP